MRFLPMPLRCPRHGAFLALILLAGCASPEPTMPAPTGHAASARVEVTDRRAVQDAGLRRRLERAARGLLYTSESDVPFTWFSAPGPFVSPITDAELRAATGAADGDAVQTITLDQFFARHIERVDPADRVAVALVPRYRHLRETLRHAIPGIRVHRIGRIRIRCYLVGTDRDGNLVGLFTESIET
jgi:hypothetical protein